MLWVTAGEPPPGIAEVACSALEALSHLRASSSFDAVVAVFPLPGWTAEELLDEARRIDSSIPVLVHDPDGSVADAVRMTKLGAYHYFAGEFDAAEIGRHLEVAIEFHRNGDEIADTGEKWKKLLVGKSQAIESVCHIVRLVGDKRCTVLITGETGTGKEMAARAIHMAGARATQAMVSLNCNALPENLLEAELFGHVKGAFTGASNLRVGRFEQAHRGTLFLDEIGDLPMNLQTKLLRVLQEKEFQRLGSSETIKVDVRVIAATNADLVERVRQGAFREDLYYRLNVVPLRMPSLREHFSDVPALVRHFLEKICRAEEIPVKMVTRETLDPLMAYSWPGNVRQLENAVEMAVALSGARDTLYASDFPLPAASERKPMLVESAAVALPDDGLDYEQTVNSFERSILEQALRRTSGNKKQAADMLRLKRTTLTAKLRSLSAIA